MLCCPKRTTASRQMNRLFPSPVPFPLLVLALLSLAPQAALAVDVRLCTDLGAIDVALDERNAPGHTANFLHYVRTGFYTGTVLHRVVAESMVQGGAYDLHLQQRQPDAPVRNESSNGLSNRRGTIAASRSEDPDSATSRFFFNLSDNPHLDATEETPGYTVFGRVTAGLDVLDAIAALPTRRVGDLPDVPVPLIEVRSVTMLPSEASFGLGDISDPARLQAAFEAARASGDAAETLAAIDALRRNCIELDGEQHIAEAEAAIELGQVERARYGLAQYLAKATALDPLLPRAQRLDASLPAKPQASRIEALAADCRRPSAPTIPDGRVADLRTMQATESAVRQHRQLGERYLSCMKSLLDSGRLNEPETIDATQRHNRMVEELTAVATRFNEAVRDFKAAHEQDFGANTALRSSPESGSRPIQGDRNENIQ